VQRHVTFTVMGKPQTKGSSKIQRGRIVNDNPYCQKWEEAVGYMALQARQGQGLFYGPVAVIVHFYVVRPLRGKAALPMYKPDLDKLTRAVLDGLTSVLIEDDAQIVALHAFKSYAVEQECAVIDVTALSSTVNDRIDPATLDLAFRQPHEVSR
jgi:Holliday junction resolvase RusA-like endonuclease